MGLGLKRREGARRGSMPRRGNRRGASGAPAAVSEGGQRFAEDYMSANNYLGALGTDPRLASQEYAKGVNERIGYARDREARSGREMTASIYKDRDVDAAFDRARQAGVTPYVKYKTKSGRDAYFAMTSNGKADAVAAAITRAKSVTGLSEEEIAAQLGGQNLEEAVKLSQGVSGAVYGAGVNRLGLALPIAGEDLVGNDMRRRAGAMAAMGLDEARLRSAFTPEPAQSLPRILGMELQPWQSNVAYGAAGAGATAALIALANQAYAPSPYQVAAAHQVAQLPY